MTCDECLVMIAREDVADILARTELKEHAATCEHCSLVLSLVAEGERDLALELAGTRSMISAHQTAERAIALKERRMRARLLVGAFVLLLVLTMWLAWIRVIEPGLVATTVAMNGKHLTETIPLQCMTPSQAGQLISPYVRAHGSLYYPAKPPVQLITVKATTEEMRTVKALLAQFDRVGTAGCPLPPPATTQTRTAP